jgi:hypothetical protein
VTINHVPADKGLFFMPILLTFHGKRLSFWTSRNQQGKSQICIPGILLVSQYADDLTHSIQNNSMEKNYEHFLFKNIFHKTYLCNGTSIQDKYVTVI